MAVEVATGGARFLLLAESTVSSGRFWAMRRRAAAAGFWTARRHAAVAGPGGRSPLPPGGSCFLVSDLLGLGFLSWGSRSIRDQFEVLPLICIEFHLFLDSVYPKDPDLGSR